MNFVKKAIITFCFIVIVFSSFAFAEESKIYGHWISPPQRGEHIKEILVFNPNGTNVSMMSIMEDCTYKLDGNILKLFDYKSKKSLCDYKIQLGENELTMTCEGKKEAVKLKRIGNENLSTATGIIGIWSEDDPLHPNQYYIFTSDGMMLFRNPVPPGIEHKFAIEGNTYKSWKNKDADKLTWYYK